MAKIRLVLQGLVTFAATLALAVQGVAQIAPRNWHSSVLGQLETLKPVVSGVTKMIAHLPAGTTPAEIASQVGAQIVTVPYDGVLRGPEGVLADGYGNSADQAVLLAEVLRQGGWRVQLAVSDAGGFDPVEATHPRQSTGGYADLHNALGADEGAMGRPAYQTHLAQTSKARSVVADQARLLLAQVVFSAAPVRAVERRIWGVEVDIDGSWTYLSPVGFQPRAIDTRITVDPAAPVMASLPDDAVHQVNISVVAETISADGITSQTRVLDTGFAPARIGNHAVQLTLAPDAAALVGILTADDNAQAAFAAVDSWQPVLQIGDQTITGTRFGASGLSLQPASTTGGGLLGAIFQEATDALSEMEGGQLGGVWVEYSAGLPGRTGPVHQRWIYDLTGAKSRLNQDPVSPKDLTYNEKLQRAEALADMIRILGQTHWTSPTAVRSAYLASLANAAAQLAILSEGKMLPDGALTPSISGAPSILALARQEISPVSDQVYLDRINILTEHNQFAISDAGKLVVKRSMDIVENGVAARGEAGLSAQEAVLAQGVADTLAEALVHPGDTGDFNPAALAVLHGDEVRWHQGDAMPAYQPAFAARIAENRSAGQLVVFSANPSIRGGIDVSAFWRIDPVTGQTLGMDARGWGASYTEYVIVTVAILICPIVYFSSVLLGFGEAAGEIFEGYCTDADRREYRFSDTSDDEPSEAVGDDPASEEAGDDAAGSEAGDDAAEEESGADESGQPDSSAGNDTPENDSPAEADSAAASDDVPVGSGTADPVRETAAVDGGASVSASDGTGDQSGGASSVPSGPKLKVVGTLLNEDVLPPEDPPEDPAPKPLRVLDELDSIGGIASDGSDAEEPVPGAANIPVESASEPAGEPKRDFDTSVLFPDRYGASDNTASQAETPAGLLGISYGF